MKSLELLGYKAVGLGKQEMLMPLFKALAQHSIDSPVPRPICSTLDENDRKNNFQALNVRPYEVFGAGPAGTPRVGVLSMIGPALENELKNADPTLKFVNNLQNVLPKTYQAFARDKVEMAMLLHHEYPAGGPLQVDKKRREMAERCAQVWEADRVKTPAIPPLQLLMVLTEEPEPPAVLQVVPGTPTQILEIGHKGKYVGVVGVFRKGNKLELKYELVRMDPGFQPAPGQKNAIIDVLERYSRQVKDENLLDAYIRSPHPIQVDPWVQQQYGGSRFIGSDACQSCHPNEWNTWDQTRHARRAFKSLEEAERPKLRQFDPECIVCHTVGFKHPEGYNDLPRFKRQALAKAGPTQVKDALAKHNAKLAHVGCENCHGPGSAHANNPNDLKVRALINPFRATKTEKDLVQQMKTDPNPAMRQQASQQAKALFTRRMDRLEDFCQKCHDQENDVHWANVPFLNKWVGQNIIHNGPNNVGNVWLPAK